jgi:uncharacterized protein YndB with AHSA1/START domain
MKRLQCSFQIPLINDSTGNMETSTLLTIETKLQILRPPDEVFEAIVDPAKMSNYFISHGSSRMEEGKSLFWRFPEFDLEFPIRVGTIIKDSLISYFWTIDNEELLVEISLTPVAGDATIVTVTEKSRNNDEKGLRWLKQNTEGWANFLACLKAWLEYDINLRKGAFDFLRL